MKDKVITGGSGVAAGTAIGYTLSPEFGFAVLQWLDKAIGPVGLIAVVALGGALAISTYGNWLMWDRLREKDLECQTQAEKDETRWSARFQELRNDGKEAFAIVGKLTSNVTVLAERMGIRMGMNVREQALEQLSDSSTDLLEDSSDNVHRLKGK